MKRCPDCATILWPTSAGRSCPKCDRMDCWPSVRKELAEPATRDRTEPYDWESEGTA